MPFWSAALLQRSWYAQHANGAIVLCDGSANVHRCVLVDDLSLWLGTGAEGSVAGSPVSYGFAIELEPSTQQAPDCPHEDETEVDLSGAMGSDTASLSQVNGSGVGGMAFTDCLESPVFETPRATLSPESKLTLPRAPIWRWFRPPRIGL